MFLFGLVVLGVVFWFFYSLYSILSGEIKSGLLILAAPFLAIFAYVLVTIVGALGLIFLLAVAAG